MIAYQVDKLFSAEAIEDAETAIWGEDLGVVMQELDIGVKKLLEEECDWFDFTAIEAISGGVSKGIDDEENVPLASTQLFHSLIMGEEDSVGTFGSKKTLRSETQATASITSHNSTLTMESIISDTVTSQIGDLKTELQQSIKSGLDEALKLMIESISTLQPIQEQDSSELERGGT